jgi:hypothetical protein
MKYRFERKSETQENSTNQFRKLLKNRNSYASIVNNYRNNIIRIGDKIPRASALPCGEAKAHAKLSVGLGVIICIFIYTRK